MGSHKNKILLLSVIILFVASPNAQADSGDLLLTINNPTPQIDDSFGSSVQRVNGNILVGAYLDDTGSIDAGTVYLFDENGALLLTINNPTPEEGDYFGKTISSTPNGNILVGAYRDNTGAIDAGTIYLYDGNNGTLLLTINNPTPVEYDNFGSSIASTINGDIIVGVLYDDTGASGAGLVYLFDENGILLFTIHNPIPHTSDHFGITVDSTTNGDILVGAYRDDEVGIDTGSVYLFNGTDGTLLHSIHNPTPQINDHFGISAASTINGDILVGAFRDDTGTTDAGSVYLFDENGTLLLTINNPDPQVGDHFGGSVSSTPNGNILVGALYDDAEATDTGSVYLFDGEDGTLLLSIKNPTPIASDSFGITVSGTENILIGAPGDDAGASNAGTVYLFEAMSELIPSPKIISLVADNYVEQREFYNGDTITILFDSDTNMPGGTGNLPRTKVNDLFTFSESIGRIYNGKWITSDTFTITIQDTTNTALIMDITTVTPTGVTPILSYDGLSDVSSARSPVLSGYYDTGFSIIQWLQMPLTEEIPESTDCDESYEYGRIIFDVISEKLYLCGLSGWITF